MQIKEAKQHIEIFEMALISKQCLGEQELEEYKLCQSIDIVLNELEKKDKVIDEMAAILTRYMSTIDNKPYDLSLGANTRKMTLEEVKEYFNKKVGDK